MAVQTVPVSDPTLLADVRRFGKFDTTGCYQCGSCTLSCDLVNGSTFPRRSIRYVLLGLREPLVQNLEPWVCHDCGDCSIVCPRQAEPRISMITLRRFLSAQYDWTGIASKLLQSKAWYLSSLIFVAALTVVLILGYHLWYLGMGTRDFTTTAMGLEHMFPIIIYYTLTVMLLPVVLLFSRAFRIWRLTMSGARDGIPLSAYVQQAWIYVYEAVAQPLMRKCSVKGHRWVPHLLLALGTGALLSIKVFALRWFQTDNIYPFYNPQRWIGYVAAACIIYGIADIIVCRLNRNKEICKETHFHDLVFPVLMLLTVVSGLTAHVLRYAGFTLGCHFTYALHVIVATPLLVIEMSFGKWSHMVYRPLALYFLAVRERAQQQVPAAEVVPNAI